MSIILIVPNRRNDKVKRLFKSEMDIEHCDFARIHFLHIKRTLGCLEWTVRLNAHTVHIVSARIMQRLE